MSESEEVTDSVQTALILLAWVYKIGDNVWQHDLPYPMISASQAHSLRGQGRRT